MRSAPSTRSLVLVGGILCLSAVTALGYRFRVSGSSAPSAARRILYYQDPMHPAYRSSKPGKAPDCGMDLEPVYSEPQVTPAAPSGSVHVSERGRQLIGLATYTVARSTSGSILETTGKVIPDEGKVYRVTALAEGVFRYVAPISVGSPVQKDQHLATYFVPTRELYNAVQAFVLASGNYDATSLVNRDTPNLKGAKAQARVEEELLQSYGLSSQQIRDLAHTHEVTRDIDLRSPVSGIVLDRQVSSGQAVEHGAEVFRIANLRSVWVLADVYEPDAARIKAGQTASVTYNGQTYHARVGTARDVDPSSHILRVRLEVDNPQLTLRPDMFVSVHFGTGTSDRLLIPSDALLDTGLRQVVFVAQKDGSFEPRQVTVGDSHGDSIEIRSGLHEGEEIVSHGTYLLDSESRLQLRSVSSQGELKAASRATAVTDPECGMPVEHPDATLSETYQGKTVYFCSRACKRKFDAKHNSYGQNSDSNTIGTSL